MRPGRRTQDEAGLPDFKVQVYVGMMMFIILAWGILITLRVIGV